MKEKTEVSLEIVPKICVWIQFPLSMVSQTKTAKQLKIGSKQITNGRNNSQHLCAIYLRVNFLQTIAIARTVSVIVCSNLIDNKDRIE